MKKQYIMLSPSCIIRQFKTPHVYDAGKDELYEINKDAFKFLKLCDGSRLLDELTPDENFLAFCLSENILQLCSYQKITSLSKQPPVLLTPSLRYLEVQITNQCNLKCRHCYIEKHPPQNLSPTAIKKVLNEFNHLQGLKVLISGGEPLLYPQIEEILEFLKTLKLRKILLTNGMLICPSLISLLKSFHEIQISLDGLKNGHEYYRGKNTFHKAVQAIELCLQEDFDVSVATMLHPGNLVEIEQLSLLLHDLGVSRWGIDVPYNTNADAQNRFFGLTSQQAAPYLAFAYGGSYHGGNEGLSCGRHLCTIMPDGHVCKCGFYAKSPIGHIREGLAKCWARLTHIPLSRLDCKDCIHLEECGGGCRMRAENEKGTDPIMCAFYREKFAK